MRWDEVKEIAPLYVIGGLDDRTARDLESSLDNATPEQQRVIAQWRDVANLLPHALPLQTPPAHLRERLLNRIVAGAQETPIEIPAEESTLEEIPESADSKILPFIRPRRAESRTARWMLIAATALFAFSAVYLFIKNTKLAHELGALALERDGLSNEIGVRRRQVDDIVSSRTRVIAMVGDEIPQANAKIIWDMKEQRWDVYIFDLPAPPSDKDYELWYVTKGAKISAAVFRTDEQGTRVLTLTLPPEALAGLAATAVTLEPRGGSPQPTGKFYLKASI
jgi:anti-sigma-K factor RskA